MRDKEIQITREKGGSAKLMYGWNNLFIIHLRTSKLMTYLMRTNTPVPQ
ncbi:hypothetical protein C5S35_14105 [Candidatus Methanophagaceae archaeon]|nr:hypothetical protein C5S35_14105 [Methanophagales archaeon]